MVIWLNSAVANNLIINDDVLLNKARSFAKSFNVSQDFKFSSGWLQRLKKRHGINQVKLYGEAASVDLEALKKAKNEIKLF